MQFSSESTGIVTNGSTGIIRSWNLYHDMIDMERLSCIIAIVEWCNNGLQSLIRECAPQAKWTHCVLHREAPTSLCFSIELKQAFEEIVKVINYVKTSGVRNRIFSKLCDDLETPHKQLLFHAPSRWLSLGNAFAQVFELRQKPLTFHTHN